MTSGSRLEENLQRSHLPALDSLRALAVGIVIVYHSGFEQVNGSLGVEIFFVLSGFLITWLLLKECASTGSISLLAFWRRRVLRLFPALYAYILVGLAAYLVHHNPVPYKEILSTIFYVQNYYVGIVRPPGSYLSMAWSLAVEEQFYLFWPAVVLWLRADLRRLTWFASITMVAVLALRMVLFFYFHVDQGYIYSAFETRLDSLMAGCLLAVLLKRAPGHPFWRAVNFSPWAPLLTAVLIGISGSLQRFSGYRFEAYSLEAVLMALGICQLLGLSHPLTWFTENRILKYLGTISYSMYLYQQLVLFTARRVTSSLPVIVQFVFGFAIVVALASASYIFIEKPFLRLKNKKAPVSQEKLTASATASVE